MLTIGIDCGITGAIAIIDSRAQLIALHDLPVMTHGRLKWIDALELCRLVTDARAGVPAQAFVELIHAMPKLGTIAASSKGLTLGSTLAALQMAGVSIELIAPQTWKRALGLLQPGASDREKKAASLARARMLFPAAELDRMKDHNRAEALLIASYAQRHLQTARQAA